MGYLRKNSFLIFSDPGAPTKPRTLDPQKVAEIEAAHEAGKKGRIDDLIKKTLNPDAGASEPPDLASATFASSSDLEMLRKAFPGFKAAEEVPVKAPEPDPEPEPDPAMERMLRQIVGRVQDLGADEPALKEYITSNSTLRQQHADRLREFAWKVFEIETSEAELPDTRYRPQRSLGTTVRFKDDGFAVNEVPRYSRWDSENGEQVALTEKEVIHSQSPALWVKVVDGWAKDGNWGGYLRITSATSEGKWIDSSRDGRLKAAAYDKQEPAKGKASDRVTFYDMGDFYEIWQNDRATGRPLVLDGHTLRFAAGATPAKWNLQDSTWD